MGCTIYQMKGNSVIFFMDYTSESIQNKYAKYAPEVPLVKNRWMNIVLRGFLHSVAISR